MPTRRTLYVVATLLTATVALIVAPTWIQGLRSSAEPVTTTCDFNRGPCEVMTGHGQHFEFSVSPRPIALMKPLQWRVSSPGRELTPTAQLRFSGVDMDMGFNRARLQRQADGSLSGEATLPVCVTGRMRWQVELWLGEAPAARIHFLAP